MRAWAGSVEGAGFGVGPALRYNTTRFDFKTSAAASMKTYFIAEGSLRFPGTIGHNEYFKPCGLHLRTLRRWRELPQEDFLDWVPTVRRSQRSNYTYADNFGEITVGFEQSLFKAGVGVGYLHVLDGDGTDNADLRPPMSSAPRMLGVADWPTFAVIQPFLNMYC